MERQAAFLRQHLARAAANPFTVIPTEPGPHLFQPPVMLSCLLTC